MRVSAAAVAVLSVAGLVAGCGKDSSNADSPVAFSPVTGDQYTSNPGAFQTDGVVVPPKDVIMVGDPIPAQAAVNAGLPQGTITSTSNNTTVYYPPAPAVPGLVVAPQPAPPAPMSRPANTRPWQYTQSQIDAYRSICETGRWGSWIAGIEQQTQTCWTLYGRQLGVRPWTPDQPRPWLRPGYPSPWFDPGFRADVPVIWVYPRSWTRPRPQPIISVSITINIVSNPYRRVPPRFTDPFYPVWAVTPGRVVDVRDQGRIVAPVYTVTTTSTTTTTVTAPVAPGVVLAPLPTSAKVAPIVALPGQAVPGNVNTDAAVTVPVAAALQGATVQAGSRSAVEDAIGTSVAVAVASPTPTTATTTTTATGGATAGTPGGTTAAPSPGAAVPSGAPTSEAVQPSTVPSPGAPTSAAPTVAPGVAPPTGGPAPTTAAPAPQTTAPGPAVIVAPAPTTVAPAPQTTVAPPPVTTQPPVTTRPPVTTQAPVVTPPPTTQAPVITPPKIVTTTLAPVPTTTVAPKPVAPKPVAPKPVVPEPTVAKPVPTTTTPAPAN
ncbi:hypothetical protein [Tsukamurella ocularis]|uniref:hypothetical protein n=1 Tax=Tsukamurella ocularis TaxID=1970234 RepID=UPI00216903E6|nr:hypothetical protein [Tsukamurella ocularis]MCS3781019.1 hypothetical protein [Tsukamurella ocularis]MCS3786843.1 hypothetical protein [Tsukamurella ocularis]MCS3850685.1 hypothetical protein [Tsukamurella ocularis]